MMKKIVIMLVMALSGVAFAQESSDNPFVYDNDTPELYEEENRETLNRHLLTITFLLF